MRLLAKKPAKLVAVAVANKMARIAWAIMAKGGYYRAPELAAAARRGLGNVGVRRQRSKTIELRG
jgi:hypothetical protein